jgi:hypothetical protein
VQPSVRGGSQVRDLKIAGQQPGQASDSLFTLYERHAQQANDIRVQDFNDRFIAGMSYHLHLQNLHELKEGGVTLPYGPRLNCFFCY